MIRWVLTVSPSSGLIHPVGFCLQDHLPGAWCPQWAGWHLTSPTLSIAASMSTRKKKKRGRWGLILQTKQNHVYELGLQQCWKNLHCNIFFLWYILQYDYFYHTSFNPVPPLQKPAGTALHSVSHMRVRQHDFPPHQNFAINFPTLPMI